MPKAPGRITPSMPRQTIDERRTSAHSRPGSLPFGDNVFSVESRRSRVMSGTISPWPVAQNGAQGHPVKTLQYLLRARGHHLAIDGVFGPGTEAAVKAFQTSKNLAPVGIVSPQTWTALV